MCKYCNEESNLLEYDYLNSQLLMMGYAANNEIFATFIDKRDNATYLRLTSNDDKNCIESGVSIKINYCPVCGEKLKNIEVAK